MKCYNCGAELSEVSFCTNCKRDMSQYKKIVYMSNRLYNDGLEKAGVRDLTGAIKSLRQSLRLNKENIDARNLLGLIYFEMGETAEALSEWVISSNFRDAENMASEYIGMIQENHTEFDVLRRSAKDYNSALDMCRQGNKDLATIRLKKIVTANSRYIRARQLLTLLYMDAKDFDKAEREISHCLAIDRTNTLSLRYLQMIQNMTDPADSDRKSIFKNDDEPVRRIVDNELIIQPANVRDPKSGSFGTIFNILIGLILGLAVMYFLVLPTRITAVRDEVKENVTQLENNLDKKNADYDALMQDLNEVNAERIRLEETLAEYTGEAGTLADIDKLIDTAEKYVSGVDVFEIGEDLWNLSRDVDTHSMSESCSALYDALLAAVSPQISGSIRAEAFGYYYKNDFENASVLLEKAYFFNTEDSEAIYFAAVSYYNAGDKVKAKALYQYVVDTYPGTYIQSQSSLALEQIESENG